MTTSSLPTTACTYVTSMTAGTFVTSIVVVVVVGGAGGSVSWLCPSPVRQAGSASATISAAAATPAPPERILRFMLPHAPALRNRGAAGRETFGSPGTYQRHGKSAPAVRPTRRATAGASGGGTPSSTIVTARSPLTRSAPSWALVMPRAWHSLPGPLQRSRSLRTA